MKFIRFLLAGLAVVVVLLAVALALAFNSGVQTWAARRVLASRPDLGIALGKLDAGLDVTRIEALRLRRPGLVLTLPAAEVGVSLADAARRHVAVKRLVAKGWTLDLSQPAPDGSGGASPAVTARKAFEGIFQQLRLPVDLSADGIDLEGDVILPAGQGTVHVVVTGGDLGPGRDGKITAVATLASGGKNASAAVNGFVLKNDLTVHMDTPRSFDHVAVVANATATGGQFSQGTAVQLALDAVRTIKDGETYTAVFQTRQMELAHFTLRLPATADTPLTGTWIVDARDADLAPLVPGRELPAFTVAGQGTFTADRTFTDLHASGRLDTTIDRLTALSAGLSAIGQVSFTTDFDATRQGDNLRIDKLSSRLSAAGKPVAVAETLQVLTFNLATHALEAARPSEDLFRFKLQGLPVAWVRPFLPGLEVTGNDVQGDFAAAARDDGFTVRSLAPLTFSHLDVSQDGRPLARSLDATLDLGGSYTPKGWEASLSRLSVTSGFATLLSANAQASQSAGDRQPVKATGSFEAALPELLDQPGAPAGLALGRGVARGKLTASLAGTQEVSLTLQVADLLTAAREPMPSVAFYVRAERDAAGRITAQAPLVITQAGRESDLTLNATVQPVKTGLRIDAKLESAALYLQDLQRFAGLVPAAPQPAAAGPAPSKKSAAAAPAVAPARAPWAGFSGAIKLALKKVVYSPAFQVTDIDGAISLTPDAISLDSLLANLGGGAALKAGGSLGYDAKEAAAPYGLKADLAVSNLDSASLLLAIDPAKTPPIDGKFDLSAHLAGRAAAPENFKDTAQADVNLSSHGGTLRALSVRAGATASTVSKAAAVVGLFGALTGNSTATKYAGKGQAAADVVTQLGNIRFDQLSVTASRNADRDIILKDITLVSPRLRLTGSGRIDYAPGVPLMRQPLAINLQLGARDQFADNLRTLRLLGNAPADAQGYAPLVEPIQLDGTLQSIGTSQLQALIDRAIAN